jgi:hypothetical protein
MDPLQSLAVKRDILSTFVNSAGMLISIGYGEYVTRSLDCLTTLNLPQHAGNVLMASCSALVRYVANAYLPR